MGTSGGPLEDTPVSRIVVEPHRKPIMQVVITVSSTVALYAVTVTAAGTVEVSKIVPDSSSTRVCCRGLCLAGYHDMSGRYSSKGHTIRPPSVSVNTAVSTAEKDMASASTTSVGCGASTEWRVSKSRRHLIRREEGVLREVVANNSIVLHRARRLGSVPPSYECSTKLLRVVHVRACTHDWSLRLGRGAR